MVRTLSTFWLLVALFQAQSRPVQRPPQAQQPPPTRVVPAWVVNPPKEYGSSLVYIGSAQSVSEAQAGDNAYNDAIGLAITDIATRLFADQSTIAPPVGVDSLRQYLRKSTRLMDSYVATDVDRRGYRAYAQLHLTRSFAEPIYVRQYAVYQTAPQPDGVAGYLIVPLALGGADATSRRVQVRATNIRSGNFSFTFTFGRVKEGLSIRLDQIQVLQDGSAGSTRWSFDVAVNGRNVIRPPAGRYDDDVGTYRMRPEDRAMEYIAKPAAPADTLELRILGVSSSAATK